MAKTATKPTPRQVDATTLRAQDLMTKDIVTVRTSTPVLEVSRLLIEKRVSNAPVIEADFTRKILAGFVSEKDVVQAYSTGRLYAVPELKAGEIMRVYPTSVRPETDLFTLAAIFMQHGYRHLPVTVGQILQGVVSRRDVLAGLMEHFRQWQFQDPATRKVPDLAGIFTPRFLLG